MLLALLLFLQYTLADYPPLRLPISKAYTVELTVGNPASKLHFTLNRTSHDVELHVSPGAISKTFSIDEYGTGVEVFGVGNRLFNLPFRVNPTPDQEIYLFHQPAAGTLGLGRYSPLWRYWDNYTICADYLVFGKYDPYSQFDSDERPALLALSEASYCALESGESMEVVFDPGRVSNYFPYALYEHIPKEIIIYSSGCQNAYNEMGINVDSCNNLQIVGLVNAMEQTLNRVSFNTTRATNENHITLGKHFADHQTVFVDFVQDKMLLSPSIFSVGDSVANSILELLLISATVMWMLIAMIDRYREGWTLDLMLQIELFAYSTALITYLTNIYGMYRDKHIADLFKYDGSLLVAYTGYVMGLSIFGSVCVMGILYRAPQRMMYDSFASTKQAASELKHLRLIFFTGATMTALWTTVLHHHDSLIDSLYVTAYPLALCAASSLAALATNLYNLQMAWLVYFQLIFNYTFLILVLLPVVDGLMLPFNHWAVVVWVVLACAFGMLSLFTTYHIKKRKVESKKS